MFLARRCTRHSLEEIGGHFGGRDHTTVMHAVKMTEIRRTSNPDFYQVVKGFEDRIKPARA
jgi:chromosomal replication initiator protein